MARKGKGSVLGSLVCGARCSWAATEGWLLSAAMANTMGRARRGLPERVQGRRRDQACTLAGAREAESAAWPQRVIGAPA